MADRKKDKWLKLFCPEDACLTEEERIVLPASEETEEHSAWLEVFCPGQALPHPHPGKTGIGQGRRMVRGGQRRLF